MSFFFFSPLPFALLSIFLFSDYFQRLSIHTLTCTGLARPPRYLAGRLFSSQLFSFCDHLHSCPLPCPLDRQ